MSKILKSENFLFFFLTCFLLTSWLTNNVPSFHFPLVLELFAFICIFLTFSLYPSTRTKYIEISKTFSVYLGLITFLLILLFFRANISFFDGNVYEQTCGTLTPWLQKIECIFQADTRQNISLRQVTYPITAGALFLTSAFLSSKDLGKFIPLAILLVGTIFCSVSLYESKLGDGIFVLPYLSSNEGLYRIHRISIILKNPTWVWVYLIPSISLSVYFSLFAKNYYYKLLSFLFFLFFSYTISQTEQRGAFLAILGFLTVYVIYIFYRIYSISNKRRFITITLLTIASIIAASFTISSNIKFNNLIQTLFQSRSVNFETFLYSARLDMWKIALTGIKEHILLGHGYGSWFKEFSLLAQANNFPSALDTAHNFFVQTVFELGFLHFIILIFIYCFFIYLSIKSSQQKVNKSFLILISLSGTIPILVVQEIDFIRSTYYQFAIFFGWVLLNETKFDHLRIKVKLKLRFYSNSILIALTSLLIYFLFTFSLGGFAYEADVLNNYAMKVRWYKQFGTINYVSPTSKNKFASYKILKTEIKSYQQFNLTSFNKKEIYDLSDQGTHYIVLPIQKYFPNPNFFEFESSTVDMERNITVMLPWHAIESDLPLIFGKGIFDYNHFPHLQKNAIWCEKKCQIRLKSCESTSDRQVLTISVPWGGDKNINIKVKNNKNRLEEFIVKENQKIQVNIEANETIIIESDLVFENELDRRKLGALLEKSECLRI